MNLPEIEKKWQKKWADTRLYSFDKNSPKEKRYVLEMFSYPSGAKLHTGHWYNYGLSDIYARFLRMKGYNVFHPMGFDAFGLPAENYAIKTGIHPKDSTLDNIRTMENQLQAMGASFDWDYEVATCLPDYYKWTQWCFLQLYKHGLAYRKKAPVNWCPQCNTVLANEQVVDGGCERCGTPVIKKHLTQWFFKITAYADELLACLEDLDWPEKTKLMQTNWIGKSVGGEVVFSLAEGALQLPVFTTRADTLYGCTYIVISPEHPLIGSLTTPENKEAVTAYQDYAAKATEIDRLSTTREKTGVFTGSYALNPANGRKIPIYAADYVLATYGTGIVMAVPAHDERDHAFATKYGLPIERVVAKKGEDEDDTLPYVGYGVLVSSQEFTGLYVEDAKKAVIEKLKKENRGDFKTTYRLRDWLISRQRYWGAPIPIIHCEHCGEVPVSESELPVELPYDVDFTPDGTSPLKKHAGFMHVVCPKCGRPALRDPDTMDTFVCSSWYFLRYPDNKNEKAAWDPAFINQMLPVDKYIGGAEHACLHLLYARFFTKAFRDMGYLGFDEPFTSLVHQGLILGPDGEKMSKSRGNVISPDSYVAKYGADVFRMYLAFGFAFKEGGPWNDGGIKATDRYLDRVERLVERVRFAPAGDRKNEGELDVILHSTIKAVSANIADFSFNTAIARLMELTNAFYRYTDGPFDKNYALFVLKQQILLLAPFAPHFAEEIWEQLGGSYSVFNESYPSYSEELLVQQEIVYPIQVNGKVKGRLSISPDATSEEIEARVKREFSALFQGMELVKFIVVPGRIVNVVLKPKA